MFLSLINSIVIYDFNLAFAVFGYICFTDTFSKSERIYI